MKTPAMRAPHQRLLLPLVAALGLASAATAHAASYHATVLADKPVAYYRMEDPAASYVITNAVNPDMFGANVIYDDFTAWPKFQQAGVDSNSVSFHLYTPDGGTPQRSHIEVPYAADLNPAGPFTTECWVRAISWTPSGENRCFLSSFQSFAAGWWFRQSGESPNRWLYVHNGGGIYMAAGNVAKNQWTHLVVTYDGTTVRFYGNGAQLWDSGGTPVPNGMGPLCLGGDPAIGGDGFFDGDIDEVAIYTNALTADQVALHYAVGLTNIAVPPVPASVVTHPAPASAYAGRTATFSVNADGTSPLSYQWYKGATPIPGATSDILTFTCAYADNGATYKVVVTNLYGSATSQAAALTVLTDLTVESSPASVTRNVGSKAAFIAVPGGALPVTYQWYKGTTLIPGATDQVLWLSNLQTADDQTTYRAEVKNPWATTNTEAATLTVVPRAVTVPITGYAKVVMADDPVAFWRLNEPSGSLTAVDAAGTFDGTYTPGDGVITYGVDSGIPRETDKAIAVTNKAQVQIPWALELNPHGPFTVELWFKPASLSTEYRDVAASDGAGPGWSGPNGWLLYQQPDNSLAWVLFSQHWAGAWLWGGPPVAVNSWYHAVLTYDGSLFRCYYNGTLTAEQAFDAFIPNGDGWASLGFRFDGGGGGFDGAFDDVAFYNKALTLDQVQAHYNATIKLGMSTSGNNIVLSWPFGTLQQADQATGAYVDLPTATSPYTNSAAVGQKFYRVKW